MELDLTERYRRTYAQDDEDSGASAADADGSDGVDAAGSGILALQTSILKKISIFIKKITPI